MCTVLPPFLSSPFLCTRDFTQGPVHMYKCSEVTVSGCTFENNQAQSVFADLPLRVFGGGLSITILYGNQNSSVKLGPINYTIHNCIFSNNSANSIVPAAGTGSVLQGSLNNGRGGGVAFHVDYPLAVKVKVLHCNFSNNYASAYGGGLYLVSLQVVTVDHFTIADNHFEGNEARSSGGGISIAAAFQQTDGAEYLNKDIFSESVIFSNNTFVQNRAIHGGAIALAPGEWTVSYNFLQCLDFACDNA